MAGRGWHAQLAEQQWLSRLAEQCWLAERAGQRNSNVQKLGESAQAVVGICTRNVKDNMCEREGTFGNDLKLSTSGHETEIVRDSKTLLFKIRRYTGK